MSVKNRLHAMVGQSAFLFIQNQKGLYSGGTWVNTLSFLVWTLATDSSLQGFKLHVLPFTLSCLNAAVLQCDSCTLVYVITDTGKSPILTSEPLLVLFLPVYLLLSSF